MNDFKITFAQRLKIDEYEPEVSKILEILGHPEAFITDESTLGDFIYKESQPEFVKLERVIGYHIKLIDYLWELAKDLREESYDE